MLTAILTVLVMGVVAKVVVAGIIALTAKADMAPIKARRVARIAKANTEYLRYQIKTGRIAR
jgi:hypothetical protein